MLIWGRLQIIPLDNTLVDVAPAPIHAIGVPE